MSRPVTLFTGQWADLPFEEICRKAASWGYDGLEIAFNLYTTLKLFEVFERRPVPGINFDPSHLLWQGLEPHLFIREFADRIYHVHMKDCAVTLDGKAGILGSFLPFGDLRRGWNFRSPGRGDVDFEEIIRDMNFAPAAGSFDRDMKT